MLKVYEWGVTKFGSYRIHAHQDTGAEWNIELTRFKA